MRWSVGVVTALVLAGACGRSRRDEAAGSGGNGASTARGGSGAGGANGGATGSGAVVGAATSGNAGAGAEPGGGGCSDSHADCACDSPDPACAGVATKLCPFRTGGCPPTLEEARTPSNWQGLGASMRAQYTTCTDGTHRFDATFIDGGYSLAFDAGGRLVYAAAHESCNRPLCGAAPTSVDCLSCRLVPADHYPLAGEGGQGGEGTEPVCEVDANGVIVMPQ